MACFLAAPSHFMKQCWLLISEFYGIHQRAISWKTLKMYIHILKVLIEDHNRFSPEALPQHIGIRHFGQGLSSPRRRTSPSLIDAYMPQ